MLFREKTLAVVALAAIMAGCASQPTEEAAPAGSAPAAAPAAAPGSAPTTAPAPSGSSAPSAPGAETPAPAGGPAAAMMPDEANREVFYDFDRSAIKDQYKPAVEANAKYLTSNSDSHVVIEGNCDERGSREYNLALGQRRANSVARALKLLGVADSQIDTVSWGKEKPRAKGHNEAAWAQNRRSDIVYK